MEKTKIQLLYKDHDGVGRVVRGCSATEDELGRFWIWSEQLQCNIVYKTSGKENALLAAINSLLFTIQLKDERIAELQRVSDLASAFAQQAFGNEEDN